MNPRTRYVAIIAVVVLWGALASGCWIRYLVSRSGIVVVYDSEELREQLEIAAVSRATVAICRPGVYVGRNYECIYFTDGLERLSTTRILFNEDIGSFGVFTYLVDPLILQVPADAIGLTGTFSQGAGSTPLVITTTQRFQVTPEIEVRAERGQKFLIIEFPTSTADSITATDPREGEEFDFTLDFSTLPTGELRVKAMLTIKIVQDGQAYYLPMLPCTIDFADIPAMTIPISDLLTDLMPQINAMLAGSGDVVCKDKLYNLMAIPDDGRLFLPMTAGGD